MISAAGRKGREKSTNYKYKKKFSKNYKRMEKYRRQDRYKLMKEQDFAQKPILETNKTTTKSSYTRYCKWYL